MLERLTIQNFQAHEKTEITFGPDLTCLVGETDSGKSAALRALRWVCTNLPTGTSFIRHGALGCTVRLCLDGQVITRRRSVDGKVNEYRLGDRVFKAFGRGVPDEIQALLNVAGLNFQGQHDAPYWFSDSPAEVARRLNALVNLGVVDQSIRAANAAATAAQADQMAAQAALEKAIKAQAALEWVAGCCDAYEALEALEAQATDLEAQATDLEARVAEAQAEHTTLGAMTAAATLGEEVLEKYQAAHDIMNPWRAICDLMAAEARERATLLRLDIPGTDDLETLFLDAQNLNQEHTTLVELIAQEKAARAAVGHGAIGDIDGLENLFLDAQDLDGKHSAIKAIINTAKKETEVLCQLNEDLRAAEQELLKNTPATCSQCGQLLPRTSTSMGNPQ